jgi:hypothetical protein
MQAVSVTQSDTSGAEALSPVALEGVWAERWPVSTATHSAVQIVHLYDPVCLAASLGLDCGS